MTDEKDILEVSKDLLGAFGYLDGSISKELIQEVERLREENKLYNLASNFDQVLGQAERIEELEAKNAECREALKHEVDLNAMNLRQCEKLKSQLSESQEKVKAYSNFVDNCFLKECPENHELFNKLMEVR